MDTHTEQMLDTMAATEAACRIHEDWTPDTRLRADCCGLFVGFWDGGDTAAFADAAIEELARLATHPATIVGFEIAIRPCVDGWVGPELLTRIVDVQTARAAFARTHGGA